jgi:hypothetical protein
MTTAGAAAGVTTGSGDFEGMGSGTVGIPLRKLIAPKLSTDESTSRIRGRFTVEVSSIQDGN